MQIQPVFHQTTVLPNGHLGTTIAQVYGDDFCHFGWFGFDGVWFLSRYLVFPKIATVRSSGVMPGVSTFPAE